MLKECKGDPYFFDRGVDVGKLRSTFHKNPEPLRKRTGGFEPTKLQKQVWDAVRHSAWATNMPNGEPTKH